MAISPSKSEEIAFEHPCFLVESDMMHCIISGNCNDRAGSCTTRNRSFPVFVLALCAALAACAPKAVEPVPAPVPTPVIAGGWSAADPVSERVQAAARFAAGQLPPGHGALAEVLSSQSQVVAGTNLRMVLRMADGTRWNALVWYRLDGTHVLTEARQVP